jgi:hypothetical protein
MIIKHGTRVFQLGQGSSISLLRGTTYNILFWKDTATPFSSQVYYRHQGWISIEE